MDSVQSSFRMQSRTSYKLSALLAIPWLVEQALGSIVVVVHENDEKVDNVEMSWISGGCKMSGTSFGPRFTKQDNRTKELVSLKRSNKGLLIEP
eukprot:5411624-Pleurochrysis_carterae.AAC.1